MNVARGIFWFYQIFDYLLLECQRIRDLFEYALYKFTLYLLTYLLMWDYLVQFGLNRTIFVFDNYD